MSSIKTRFDLNLVQNSSVYLTTTDYGICEGVTVTSDEGNTASIEVAGQPLSPGETATIKNIDPRNVDVFTAGSGQVAIVTIGPLIEVMPNTSSGNVTVTGGATEAKQDAGNTKLDTIATNQATQATAANQTIANTSLSAINTNTDQIEGYLDGVEGKLDTVITSAATTVTNTGTTATNTSAISSALVSAETTWTSVGASAAPTLKSGSGKVWTLFLGNASATTDLYAWIYDNTSASGTLIVPIPIPVLKGSFVAIGNEILTGDGKSFSTGLTVGFSTSRASYSVHSTAADCHVGGYGS